MMMMTFMRHPLPVFLVAQRKCCGSVFGGETYQLGSFSASAHSSYGASLFEKPCSLNWVQSFESEIKVLDYRDLTQHACVRVCFYCFGMFSSEFLLPKRCLCGHTSVYVESEDICVCACLLACLSSFLSICVYLPTPVHMYVYLSTSSFGKTSDTLLWCNSIIL